MWLLTWKAGCCVEKTPGKVSGNPGDFWSLWRTISWCMQLMNWLGEMLCWTWYSQTIKNRLKMWRLRAALAAGTMKLWCLSSWEEWTRQTSEWQAWTSKEQILACAGTCLAQSHGKLLLRGQKDPGEASWSSRTASSEYKNGLLQCAGSWATLAIGQHREHGAPVWAHMRRGKTQKVEAGTGYSEDTKTLLLNVGMGSGKPKLTRSWN